MPDQSIRSKILIIAILAGICIALFGSIDIVELRGEEPRRAIVAMEMDITGEYIVPKINGWNYYNKPPLFNWVLAGFFKLFGSYDDWVARIPSLLALLLTAFVHFFFVKKYVSKEIALLSSLFFLTSGDIFFYGTQLAGEIDLFYSFLVYLQIISIYHFGYQKKYLWLFVFSYTLAALGALTKGLPSIAFQGITLVAWFAYNKDMRRLFHWTHFAGLLSFFLITSLYFYAYSNQTDVVPYLINLIKESSQRSPAESKAVSIILGAITYPISLLKFLLPWSVLAIYLFSKKSINAIRTNDFLIFCVVFIIANIPLYWFSGDAKSRYVYMFFPFIVVVIAFAWKESGSQWPQVKRALNILFTTLVITIPVAGLILPWMVDPTIISYPLMKGIVISMASGFAAWGYLRDTKNLKIYYVIISLIFVRIGVNFFYLPTLNHNIRAAINLQHLERLYKITGDRRIYLSGAPFSQVIELNFGPLGKITSVINTAPLLTYILPYHYSEKTREVMQYEEVMSPGRYYLINLEEICDYQVDTLYTFQDTWTKDDMGLVILKDIPN